MPEPCLAVRQPLYFRTCEARPPRRGEARSTFTRNVRHILCTLPVQSNSADTMYSAFLSHLKSAWHIEWQVSPWFAKQEAISEFQKQWSDSFAFTPSDKNTGKCMILCQCLYAQRNLSLYDDPKQFEVVSDPKDDATSKRVALDMLRDRAESAGIQRFRQSGKRKDPPVTFCLPKNKMLEEHGEFKATMLFPYYKHPLRYYGRLVGRYLTLM